MSVYCECCVLSGRGLWVGLIERQMFSTECGCLSVIVKLPKQEISGELRYVAI